MPVVHPEVFKMKIYTETSPTFIWRKVLIPEDYTFYDFRITIEDLFDVPTTNTLPKYFFILADDGRSFFIKDSDVQCPAESNLPELDEREVFLRDYNMHLNPGSDNPARPNISAIFGNFDVVRELQYLFSHKETRSAVLGQSYPQCIGGAMASPPHFCKTFLEYNEFMKKDKREQESLMYMDYDPHKFDPLLVKFRKPKPCSKMY